MSLLAEFESLIRQEYSEVEERRIDEMAVRQESQIALENGNPDGVDALSLLDEVRTYYARQKDYRDGRLAEIRANIAWLRPDLEAEGVAA